MAREYIIVELVGRVEGDEVVLLDSDLQKVAKIHRDRASLANKETIESIERVVEWRAAFRGMVHSINAKNDRMQQTPWQKKCGTWTTSIRHRRNRKNWNDQHFKRKSLAKRYSDESRPTWDAAIKCMLYQYINKTTESRLRQKNPWRLWAQTVIGNHRKKGKRREESIVRNSKAIGEKVARAGIRMCAESA